jgi:hypothetical protein
MTAVSKTLILAALATAVGISVYATRRVSDLQGQLQTLQENKNPLLEQASKARQELDEVVSNLAVIQQQNEQLRNDTRELPALRGAPKRLRADAQELAQLKDAIATTCNDPASVAAVQSWMGRVADLKRRFEQTPDQKVPEFHFLTEQDWLNATRDQLETDTDYRKSMAALREAAQGKFAVLACTALRLYLKDRDPRLDYFSQPYQGDWRQLLVEQFPADLLQLQPYFESPIDDAILQRWEILTGDKLRGLGTDAPAAITQKAAVDEKYDARWCVSLSGPGCTGWRPVSR